MCYKSEYKNIQTAKRRTQFLKSSTIENHTRSIENRRHDFSTEFKLGPSPRKCLGFQSNTTRYKKKTLTTFSELLEEFGGALVKSKRYYIFFQSHYWNSIYILLELVDLKLLQQDHT